MTVFQVTADLGLVGVFSRACDSVGARLERGPSERNPVKQCALSWVYGLAARFLVRVVVGFAPPFEPPVGSKAVLTAYFDGRVAIPSGLPGGHSPFGDCRVLVPDVLGSSSLVVWDEALAAEACPRTYSWLRAKRKQDSGGHTPFLLVSHAAARPHTPFLSRGSAFLSTTPEQIFLNMVTMAKSGHFVYYMTSWANAATPRMPRLLICTTAAF